LFLWKTNDQGQYSQVDFDPSSRKFIGPSKPFSKKLRIAALCIEGFLDIMAMAQYSHPLAKSDYSAYEPFWTDKGNPEDIHYEDLLGFRSTVKSVEVNPIQVTYLVSSQKGLPCGWITSQELNQEENPVAAVLKAVKAFIITSWMGDGKPVSPEEISPQFQIDKDLFGTYFVKYLISK